MGATWTVIKVFFYSACGNKEHPGNLQNKPISFPFNWVSRYILFLAKLKRRGRSFLEGARRTRAALWDYPQEQLVVIGDEKVCTFMKFEIIVPLLCCLLDFLTNKYCRTCSSMINLWIDSRTCQKHRILLSERQSSKKLPRAFKRKCFGEYNAVTLTRIYLKFVHDMVSRNSWINF